MDENDMFDGMTDEPATVARERIEVTEEERAIVEAVKGLTDEGRQVIWELLRRAYAAQREAPS